MKNHYWPTVILLLLALLALAPALAKPAINPCTKDLLQARLATQQALQLPVFEALTALTKAYQASDSPCLSSLAPFEWAFRLLLRQHVQLRRSDGAVLAASEVYVCNNGFDGQRCDGIYADDSTCWCEIGSDQQVKLPRQVSIMALRGFRVRWYWGSFGKTGFLGYQTLASHDGRLDLTPLRGKKHQTLIALVSTGSGFGYKMVWRIASAAP
jgi:hypothetical protein